MAMMSIRFTAAQTNAELIPAQDGKIIRVTRLVVTTWANVKIALLSDPGPQGQGLLTPLHVSSSGPLVLNLGRGGAIAAERGKALGITSTFQSAAGEHTIVAWYELVS